MIDSIIPFVRNLQILPRLPFVMKLPNISAILLRAYRYAAFPPGMRAAGNGFDDFSGCAAEETD